MGKQVTFTATYNGKTFTRTSRTVTYTHVTLAKLEGDVVAARWSKSAKAAATALPNGWESARVAVVEVTAQGQAPKAEQAPAADTELCASNSRAKGMHLRVKGQQVSVCGAAKTSRKPNAAQLADSKVCAACTGH